MSLKTSKYSLGQQIEGEALREDMFCFIRPNIRHPLIVRGWSYKQILTPCKYIHIIGFEAAGDGTIISPTTEELAKYIHSP